MLTAAKLSSRARLTGCVFFGDSALGWATLTGVSEGRHARWQRVTLCPRPIAKGIDSSTPRCITGQILPLIGIALDPVELLLAVLVMDEDDIRSTYPAVRRVARVELSKSLEREERAPRVGGIRQQRPQTQAVCGRGGDAGKVGEGGSEVGVRDELLANARDKIELIPSQHERDPDALLVGSVLPGKAVLKTSHFPLGDQSPP
jgi:hypothetical protein